MNEFKSFASDNNAPVHQSVLQAIVEVNHGDAIGYGDDVHTLASENLFREVFGDKARAYFMFTGTAANVTSISHICRPYEGVICSDKAHMENDECGAPEKHAGNKLLTIPSPNGKLTPGQMLPLLASVGFPHHVQPRVVSITQATELGAVYSPGEIQIIADFAHDNHLFLHMDGARLANAAAALGCSLKDITADVGVDVLSFGGTKNGLMAAEAVVFFNEDLARNFEYTRKQSMQLASKMRYISAQFLAYFSQDLWLSNALHANKMASMLADAVSNIQGVELTQKVETNAVFAIIPRSSIEKLQRKYFFYIWDASRNEVRWMTSFYTKEEDVMDFVEALKEAVCD